MRPTVAYQGVPGAFSEEACRRFVPDHEPVARSSFAAVAEAVLAGEVALGVLPRRNSTVGAVPGIEDLVQQDGLVVQSCHDLPVRLHVMARPGTALEGITTVVSHPVALGQCAGFLARKGYVAEEAENTAMAAQALTESGKAAIASEAAAAAYGLTILIRDVHDRPDNATTFCVVARGHGDQP